MQVEATARAQVKAAVTVIETELGHGQPYILGENFTAADIGLIHGLRNAEVMTPLLSVLTSAAMEPCASLVVRR